MKQQQKNMKRFIFAFNIRLRGWADLIWEEDAGYNLEQSAWLRFVIDFIKIVGNCLYRIISNTIIKISYFVANWASLSVGFRENRFFWRITANVSTSYRAASNVPDKFICVGIKYVYYFVANESLWCREYRCKLYMKNVSYFWNAFANKYAMERVGTTEADR